MKKLLLCGLLMAMIGGPGFAMGMPGMGMPGTGRFALKAGGFMPSSSHLKNSTATIWPMVGAEVTVWRLPVGSVALELDWMSRSKTGSNGKTTVDMIPVLLDYHFKMPMSGTLGVGAGVFNVKAKTPSGKKSSTALGGKVFYRYPFANVFTEVAYQFANASVGSSLGNQNGFLMDVGIKF